ncbi:MAG TPA: Hint domain-containing protein [Acidiphilium sp.]|nr:MAG: hypothetical protein B7Z67_03260 [Acidiphilium sp. 21-60-14]OYV91110.1 MAG: hypothetical protein B7Z57_05555 [Acidiphilium sp. 37-60-79]OZB39981.1 MAG: hypothetical protein B7X48_07000 [Acidiphilium sp. 34-60-192]HQT86977.1 Hint domain-containing protein [Acidiphilium sp.]HQU22976.1 Hint domain-containing protein [Acidiphilium sp.]
MSGTITGLYNGGVTLVSGGAFGDPLTIAGTIEAAAGNGVLANQPWSLDNQGLIAASVGDGILLNGGLIGTDSVLNVGVVTGGSYGVRLASVGGVFTNATLATVSGTLGGVYFSGQAPNYSSFINAGLVSGGSGAGLRGSELMVSNGSSGVIDGGAFGVALGIGASLVNEGLISGAVGVATSFNAAGAVSLLDAGTIIGTGGIAVSFSAGDGGTLGLLPGASFSGALEGANATLAFEGTSLGSFGQFAAVNGFAEVAVAAGAMWDFGGNVTLNTSLGLDNAGILAETQGQQLLIEHGLSGAGTLMIGGGALTLIRGAAAAAQTIAFAAGGGTLALAEPQSFSATIADFAYGDTIELIGLAQDATVTGSMVGSVLELAGSVPNGTTIAFNNPPPGIELQPVAGPTKIYDIVAPPCFAQGTRLLTPNGMRPVESLRKGDLVITRSGAMPIIWHGRRRVDCARHPMPTKVWPVCVERDAFGPGLPMQAVWLSPDHALFAEGALIPVQFLLNGVSIRQEPVATVIYHHIELERHEIVWAENLPAETYLDCGNRHQFGGRAAAQPLHADFAPPTWAAARACAPLVTHGPAVAAARKRANAMLVARGYRAEPVRLMMFAGGEVVPVAALPGRWYRAAIPRGADALTLRSVAAPPAAADPWSADRRHLGLAIEAVTLDGRRVEPEDRCFGEGFYPPEQGARDWFRWTNGAGTIMTGGASALGFRLRGAALSWRGPAPLSSADSQPQRRAMLV